MNNLKLPALALLASFGFYTIVFFLASIKRMLTFEVAGPPDLSYYTSTGFWPDFIYKVNFNSCLLLALVPVFWVKSLRSSFELPLSPEGEVCRI